MKTKNQLLLYLLGVSLFGCNSTPDTSSSDINTDFPVTEQLKITPSYQIAIAPFFHYNSVHENGICVIDGSLLWYVKDGENDCGACYDLNTGNQLSVIATKGTTANQISTLTGFKIMGDSLQLYEGGNTIKTFAKKAITDNTPLETRTASVTTAPDSIWVARMAKLPNGSVIATIHPPFEFQREKINEINKKSVAIFNWNTATSHETINYDSFNIESPKTNETATDELIKWTYAQGAVAVKDNNTAVFAASNQFILYTFDLNTGKVTNEKRYTSPLRTGETMAYMTINDMELYIHFMQTNDKYIFCKVKGYLSQEDKDIELKKEALFVFDWNLKPIKKYELPEQENIMGYYTLSTDCKSVYFCEYNEEGIMLHKADLNL